MLPRIKRSGFTLIELIIVVAILGVLATVLVPTIVGFIQDARDNSDLANAHLLYTDGILALSTSTSILTLVPDYPTPQGRTGEFQVWNVDGEIEVYIVGDASYLYDPQMATFDAIGLLPESSSTVVQLAPA